MHYDSRPLGHKRLDTTARYLSIATGRIAKVESPLDRLTSPKRKKPGKTEEKSEEEQPLA